MTGPGDERSFWRDNSLSLVFGGLLLLTLAAQSWWGAALYNEEARSAGADEILDKLTPVDEILATVRRLGNA